MTSRVFVALSLAMGLSACPGAGEVSVRDGVDSGASTTLSDGGGVTVDAGRIDAGAPKVDAGAPTDGGVPTLDAGLPPRVDGGATTDAGIRDAGTPGFDAGSCNSVPAGWPPAIAPWVNNPVMIPSVNGLEQGADNIYAPDIVKTNGRYVMWYGAQSGDGHDEIFMAWSTDRAEWRKWPTDDAPAAALSRGSSYHVNDPSVVSVGSAGWRMYFTDASAPLVDRIWLATSTGLTGFTRVKEVVSVGPPGSWDSEYVGRPSVLLENGFYKMWFDGTHNGQRHVGYATSTDGLTFTKHPLNPLVQNAGAVDVKRIGGVYVMVAESGDGTYWYVSPDGVNCWVSKGKLFGLSGSGFDAYGQVTPFLDVENDMLRAVWFGGATVAAWDKNRIGAAFVGGTAPNGGGCTACVLAPGQTCSGACNSVGYSAGACAMPQSTDVRSCCACQSDGCDGCRDPSFIDCQSQCVSGNRAGGSCTAPGSSDPAMCCTCFD